MAACINLCSALPLRVGNVRTPNWNHARTPVVSAVANGGRRAAVVAPPDEVDVLVIGSGVGGLCAASLLARCDHLSLLVFILRPSQLHAGLTT